MATYLCDCGKPADWFLRQVDGDGNSVPMGKSWTACNQHVSRAMPAMVGITFRVSAVSRTWQEHMARPRKER